jgi:hypothetical protein
MANAQLLQLLAAIGQQQQKINQTEQQQQRPNYCGHINKSSINILGTTNFAPMFGGTADAEQLEAMARNELIKVRIRIDMGREGCNPDVGWTGGDEGGREKGIYCILYIC